MAGKNQGPSKTGSTNSCSGRRKEGPGQRIDRNNRPNAHPRGREQCNLGLKLDGGAGLGVVSCTEHMVILRAQQSWMDIASRREDLYGVKEETAMQSYVVPHLP